MKVNTFLTGGMVFTCMLMMVFALAPRSEATLVTHYQLDGDAYDYGSGNSDDDGTIYGASWVTANGNTFLEFDGVNDYVYCGNGSDFTIVDKKITLHAWVCPSETQTGYQTGIMGKDISSYLVTYYSVDKNAYWFIDNTGYHTNAYLEPGVWSQLVVTYDGSNQKIYINGAFVGIKSCTVTPSAGGNFYIGRWGDYYFKGFMDDIRVYDDALTDNQVASLYSATTRNEYNTMFAQGVEDSLKAHYDFYSNADDYSKHGNDGTIHEDEYDSDDELIAEYDTQGYFFGHCLSLDGTGDYVNCGNGSSLNIEGKTLTLMAWVRPTSVSAEYGIAGKNSASYMLTYYTNNNFYGYINDTGNSVHGSAPLNQWSQIAMVYDGRTGTQKIKPYVNGMLGTTCNYSTDISSSSNYPFQIGRWGDTNYFNGKIDEVRVYNKALTNGEIYDLFLNDYDVRNKGLVAHYKFDKNSGTQAADLSGRRNTGTLYGGYNWVRSSIIGSGALEFDGDDDYVGCGSGSSLNITNEITMMAWIYPSANQTSSSVPLMGKSIYSYLVTCNTVNGNLYLCWYNYHDSSYSSMSAPLIPGVWSHVAVTYNGTNMNIYINGQACTAVASAGIDASPATNFIIGGTASTNFKGLISEVKVYNQALTSEIVDDYNYSAWKYDSDESDYGLLAYYKFNEGEGSYAFDSSSYRNVATLFGAGWSGVNDGSSGYCAKITEGSNDYVDLGNLSTFNNINGTITLAAWICPEKIPYGETTIVGKGLHSQTYALNGYTLNYYRDGNVYFYLQPYGDSPPQFAETSVQPGSWTHIAATYDGRYMTMYRNGEALNREDVGSFTITTAQSNLLVGSMATVSNGSGRFPGWIDEVKVYNRALSASEIAGMYNYSTEKGYRDNMFFVTGVQEISAAKSISSGSLSVRAIDEGRVEIKNGTSYLLLDSSFSYYKENPETYGYNWFSNTGAGETGWNPSAYNDGTLIISANGSKYNVTRYINIVTLQSGIKAVTIEDKYSSLNYGHTGILIDHTITTPDEMENIRYGNWSWDPILFFGQLDSDFGIVVEDDLGRLNFSGYAAGNVGHIKHSHFGMENGIADYTFKYTVYPLPATGDVYEFINAVRKDWGSDSITIEGPCTHFSMDDTAYLGNPVGLADFLDWTGYNVLFLFEPWLDYEPGIEGEVLSRADYDTKASSIDSGGVAHKLKAARTGINVLGAIETQYVTLDKNTINPYAPYLSEYLIGLIDGEYSGTGPEGYVAQNNEVCTDAITTHEDSHVPWAESGTNDSIYWGIADSVYRVGEIEFYFRDNPSPPPVYRSHHAMGVYPTSTNYHGSVFMPGQISFLMNDVGLDGAYIDTFSHSTRGGSIQDYGRWDGHSMNIGNKGEILSVYQDCSYAGKNARVSILSSILDNYGCAIVNGYSTSAEEQGMGAWRVSETYHYLKPDLFTLGNKPPFIHLLGSSQLSTPIGFDGSPPDDVLQTSPEYAKGIYKNIMWMLRHGMLYYNFHQCGMIYDDRQYESFGSYNALKAMFPITPKELHEGWIKGAEKIITCVDIETDFTCQNIDFRVYDMYGRDITTTRSGVCSIVGGTVTVSFENEWSEFCIIGDDNSFPD